MKKVLIIAFFFPPNSTIGGRRWAYHAKQLHKNKVDVYVITSDYVYDNKHECPWYNTIEGFENKIYYLKHSQPTYILNMKPDNLIDKIKYRLDLMKARILKSDCVYDRSLYFSDSAYKKAKRIIIDNDITNVIVTGGPFHLMYRISLLKKELGNRLNLIADFRDPWTEKWNISDEFQAKQRKKQDIVMKLTDIIFVPDQNLIKEQINIWNSCQKKIQLLPHGFDSEIFNYMPSSRDFKKWFYAGTVYPKMDKEYHLLENILNYIEVELFFYTIIKPETEYPVFNNRNLHSLGAINQKDLVEKTRNFGVALYLAPDAYKEYKTTKFYELVNTGIFILYVGRLGEVSKYIIEHKIGFVIDVDAVQDVVEITRDLNNAFNCFEPKPYLSKEFSFENLTQIIYKNLL
ncbi:MAG: hypothetical protein IT237_06640 [Bacteroidia bacterium]|nr:hypothetical protein [Bacteroidia bacterium]